MRLQHGKCYLDRKGDKHGPLAETNHPWGEPYRDPLTGLRWFANGSYHPFTECDLDLVEECEK